MIFCSKEDIRDYIETKKEQIKNSVTKNTVCGWPVPTLAIIQVGDNPASNRYVKGKISDCEEVGIKALHYRFDENISIANFSIKVAEIVANPSIHGVIIQKPLPALLDRMFDGIVAKIPREKDVDGFRKDTKFKPCTPKGIVDYIENRKGEKWLEGKNVVIVNRTDLVGRPLAKMMLDRNATVTVCHSKTVDLDQHCIRADVLVSAIGKPHFMNHNFIKYSTVCIDVGISFDENGKMCGDFDREDALRMTNYCTPVPGGVGLLTRLALLENVMKAYEMQKHKKV